MHAVIENPELLRKIHHIDMICPPAEMVSHGEFFITNTHRLALFMSRKFPFLFDPLFLKSLKTDTEETNQAFIETLKRHKFRKPIRAYFNPLDPFLSKVDEKYSFRIQRFLHKNTGLNLHIHRIEYGHNYEGYEKPQ